MQRVREAIALNAELKDESTWLGSSRLSTGLSLKTGRRRSARGESRGFVQSLKRMQPHGCASFGACDADFILNDNQML